MTDASSRSWEQDPRPLGECLKAWAASHGWSRDQAATELRAPRSTYDKWCDGRSPAREPMIRRMLDLIDSQNAKSPAPR